MKILVTGAAGFVGRRVTRALAGHGHEVHGLCRRDPGPGVAASAGPAAIWVADLADGDATAAVVRAVQPDAVVHLAWYTEPGRYLHDVPANLRCLAAGTTLLRCLAEQGCGRVVLAGTCLEAAQGAGSTIYAACKRALHGVATATGAAATCCHVFSVYGPGEHECRALPSAARSLLAGRPAAVSTGEVLRDYLHVDDVADAIALVVASPTGPTLDVCSGLPLPLRSLFAAVGQATGRPDLLRWGEHAVGQDEDFQVAGDPGPLQALGWAPAWTLEAGVAATVDWWRGVLAPAGAPEAG